MKYNILLYNYMQSFKELYLNKLGRKFQYFSGRAYKTESTYLHDSDDTFAG